MSILNLEGASQVRVSIKQRYGILRFIVALLRVIGVLQIIVGLLFGVVMFGENSRGVSLFNFENVYVAVFVFILVAAGGILTYGFAELLQVAMDIEENTRRTLIVASAPEQAGGPGAH